MAKAMQTTKHEECTAEDGEVKRKRWKGKKKNKPCIHESNGRHWWKSKWTPQGVEKKRTDTYPNLCYLATDLWTYSITSWLTKGITVGGGLRPIRLEYKNITPFFLNNRKCKVNTRLFSCCGHNKYILSHENQGVRPRRSPKLQWFPTAAAGTKGPHQFLLEPRQELPQTSAGTGSGQPELQKALKAMWNRESPSLGYFALFVVPTPSCLWLTWAPPSLRHLVMDSHCLGNISCFGP